MALSFSKTGSAIGGVAKTIFPGLIVSVIGASFGFLVFNNPEKIRGKATLRAWESLKQYERLYIENTDRISCGYSVLRFDRLKTDMLHQIQLIIENLKNIQEKESNVDNLMLSIINMKIDSYNEIKKLTEAQMDSLLSLNQTSNFSEDAITKRLDKWKNIYGDYMEESAYLKDRDTTSTNRILKELSKTYALKFIENKFLPDSAELSKNILGTWNFALFPIKLVLKPDGGGYIKMMNDSMAMNWRLESDTIKVKSINTTDRNGAFVIKRVYPDILVLSEENGTYGIIVVACRSKYD